MWVNAETKFGDLTARLSFNHWATPSAYTSSDRDVFGAWPCYQLVAAFPVIEANELVNTWTGSTDSRHGQKYYVHGTVVVYYPSLPPPISGRKSSQQTVHHLHPVFVFFAAHYS